MDFVNKDEADGLSSFFESRPDVSSDELLAALHAIGAFKYETVVSALVTKAGDVPPHDSDEVRSAFMDHWWSVQGDDTNATDVEAGPQANAALQSHINENLSYYLGLATSTELAWDIFLGSAPDAASRDGLDCFRDEAIAGALYSRLRLFGLQNFLDSFPNLSLAEITSAMRNVGAVDTMVWLEEASSGLPDPVSARSSSTRSELAAKIRPASFKDHQAGKNAALRELEDILRAHIETQHGYYLALEMP